jgi:hypothetical protein
VGMGAGFYALQIPFVYFWSLPFVIGGAFMIIVSLFVAESPGPPQPPEGSRYCPFCSTVVPLGAERCPHCNGLQRREA